MRKVNAETIKEALGLYRSGKTFEEVAQLVGHHRSTIIRAFKKLKEPSHSRNFNRKGIKNGRWKSGYRLASGYARVWVPDDHKFASERCRDNSIMQHRLVMMEHLDRPLYSHETVHHINGNKLDNRIENLQLIVGNHGTGISLKCGVCGSANLVPTEKGA